MGHIVANGTDLVIRGNSTFDGSVDDVSIEQLTTGRNRAQNPGFDTDTIWGKGAGWAIASGMASATAGSASDLIQTSVVTVGVEYETIIRISGRTAGTATIKCGTGAGTARSADGIYTERITAAGNTSLIVSKDATFDGDIEYVICRPVSNATNGRYARNIALNNFFDNWTGDDPDDWTVTEVGDATSNITENPAGHCQIISDGTLASIAQANLAAGKTYVITIHVSTVTLGGITVTDGTSSTAITTVGVHKIVLTAAGTTLTIQRTAACDVTIDYVHVEQILIQPSSAFPKAESLDTSGDGVMDKNNWTAGNNAALTNPSSGILRVERDGVNNPNAQNHVVTNGLRYRITGQVRSDGNVIPRISDATPNHYFVGTTSTDWQPFDFEAPANFTSFVFWAFTSTGAEYCEWRNLSVVEVNPLNADITAAQWARGNKRYGPTLKGDGLTSYINILSAELNSILDRNQGSVFTMAQSDDWSAGTAVLFILGVDGNNLVYSYRSSAILLAIYKANSIVESVSSASGSPNKLFSLVSTWDTNASEFKGWYNAAQMGTTQAIAGVFSASPLTVAIVGAANTAPGTPWEGEFLPFALFDEVLDQTTIQRYTQMFGGFLP